MKLTAILRIKEEENLAKLVQVFFKSFNPNNKILISKDEVIIEVELDGVCNLEAETIGQTISACTILFLQYGNQFYKTEETSEENKTVNKEEEKEEIEAEQNPTISEEQEKESIHEVIEADYKETVNTYLEEEELIQKLDEIAKNSETFAKFLLNIAEWLEIRGKSKNFLLNVFQVTDKIDKINWSNVFLDLEISDSNKPKNRNYYIHILRNKLKRHSKLKAINFIRLIEESYRPRFSICGLDFELSKKESSDTKISSEPIEEPKEEEKKILSFEETIAFLNNFYILNRRLKNINKKTSIYERVNCVMELLRSCRLNPKDEYMVYKICEIGVQLKEITFEAIFENEKLNSYSKAKGKLLFSSLINDLVRGKNVSGNLDPIAFLTYLQENILTESEKQML